MIGDENPEPQVFKNRWLNYSPKRLNLLKKTEKLKCNEWIGP